MIDAAMMDRIANAIESIADAQQRMAAVAEADFYRDVEAAAAERADAIRTAAVDEVKRETERRGFIGQV